MDVPMQLDTQTEQAIHEFEDDLRSYRAAGRRSAVFGLLAFAGVLLASCVVCSGIIIILR